MVAPLMLVNCGGGGGGVSGGTLPAAPTGLIAAVSPNQVMLAWSASANATGYRIYRSSSSGLSKSTVSPRATTTSYIYHDPAADGNTYYYVVTALNGVYESASSAEVSARLMPPVAPATVIATAGNGIVRLSWSDSPNATFYSVYKSAVSGTSYSAIASGFLSLSTTDTSVINGVDYYYVVTATNAFGEGPQSPETAATPTSSATGTTTISGTISYEDREYDQIIGHNGNTSFKAVRFAEIELVNASTGSAIATGATSSTGFYSVAVSSAAASGVTIYVRVLSTAKPATGQSISVRTVSTSPQRYAVKSSNFIPTGNTTVNLSIPVTNTADSAFNILDAMTSGFQMINSVSTSTPVLTLNTHWQPNNTNAGSYSTFYCDQFDSTYCPGGSGIYVMSAPFGIYQDTDDFDDDVLWHELGHYISDKLSKDQSPGGTHYLNVNTQDMRLSWSEGWGNFFQTAVKDWLNANQPALLSTPVTASLSEYIDTEIGGYYISLNISAPETSPPGAVGASLYCENDECKYSTNEISVANVLWNLMSSAGSGGFGFQPIWNVVNQYLPGQSKINLDTFWDGWLSQRAPAAPELVTLDLVFYGTGSTGRLINYKADAFETDNLIATAVTYTTPQDRTIYGTEDQDFVAFVATGTSHTITTWNLRNGADTYLTLYGPSTTYNVITTIDNTTYPGSTPPNTTTALSSRIIYSSFIPGLTYYISTKSATTPPVSAGKYGSYTLTISP